MAKWNPGDADGEQGLRGLQKDRFQRTARAPCGFRRHGFSVEQLKAVPRKHRAPLSQWCSSSVRRLPSNRRGISRYRRCRQRMRPNWCFRRGRDEPAGALQGHFRPDAQYRIDIAGELSDRHHQRLGKPVTLRPVFARRRCCALPSNGGTLPAGVRTADGRFGKSLRQVGSVRAVLLEPETLVGLSGKMAAT